MGTQIVSLCLNTVSLSCTPDKCTAIFFFFNVWHFSLHITRAISSGEEMLDSLIFSDQYVGPKQPDDEYVKCFINIFN